jgi:hypothetical protein
MVGSLFLPSSAQAGFKTSTDVLNFCTDSSALRRSICLGYLQGLADGLQIGDIGVARLCIPGNLTGQQLIDVAVGILKQIPADETNEAVVYIGPAFAKTWSCTATSTAPVNRARESSR